MLCPDSVKRPSAAFGLGKLGPGGPAKGFGLHPFPGTCSVGRKRKGVALQLLVRARRFPWRLRYMPRHQWRVKWSQARGTGTGTGTGVQAARLPVKSWR